MEDQAKRIQQECEDRVATERQQIQRQQGLLQKHVAVLRASLDLTDSIEDNLLVDFTCAGCLRYPMTNPQVLTPCGHTFCEECISKWKTSNLQQNVYCVSCTSELPATDVCCNLLADLILSRVQFKKQELHKLRATLVITRDSRT